MTSWTVNVYVSASASAAEKDRVGRWCSALSNVSTCKGFAARTIDAGSLSPEVIESGDVHVLWWGEAMARSMAIEFSDLCDEHLRPGLVVAEGEHPEMTATSVIVQSANESIDASAARIHGMLARQVDIRRLQHELSLSMRCTGGLRGEITRMHDELQLAAMVQQEFLPRELPDVHGVRFAAMWQPASYVSGDIYDVCRLDEDHVSLFLADAVGHGVPAALLTMVICRSLPTREVVAGRTRIVPPSEALARLNAEMIRRQGRTTRFATAVYGVLNCRTRVLKLAGAGHPAPLIFRRDGRSESLETPGGLLGVFEGESFDHIEVQLNVDDRLVMFSDGFEVAFPNGKPGLRPGGERQALPSRQYLEEFERLRAESDPKLAMEAMREAVSRQQGSLHQIDDLTLLCTDVGMPVQCEPVQGPSPREAVTSRGS